MNYCTFIELYSLAPGHSQSVIVEVRALNQSNDLIDVPSEVREGNRFRFLCNVSNSEDYPQAEWQFRWSNSADGTWHHEGQGVEIIVRIHWKFLSEFHATKMSLL